MEVHSIWYIIHEEKFVNMVAFPFQYLNWKL